VQPNSTPSRVQLRLAASTSGPLPGGAFEVDLGQKDNWTADIRVPEGGNIVHHPVLADPDQDGSMVLTGHLEDPSKPGYVIVLVDPVLEYMYFFVTIAPGGASSVEMESWGGIKSRFRK